jgi:hypothetical protein
MFTGKKKEPFPWVKRTLQGLFIFICVAAIVAMIVLNPKQKPLVCGNPIVGQGSLTTFGTCVRQ